jgi:DNA-directed RNA polymerase subunit beta
MESRHTFGKLRPVIQPPNLIEIQTQSYADFLQRDVAPLKRENKGLQAVFKEVFPIVSYDGRYVLDFIKYEFEEPKQTYTECLEEGNGTYAAPLKAYFRLKIGDVVREGDKDKDQVYLGEIPLMAPDGAFIINGAERVIVSQLHRSPGLCAERSIHTNGQPLYSVRLIPDRGTWLEIQFDTNDILWIHMDRRRRSRKFHATTFLRAIGFGSDEQILKLFYGDPKTLDVRKPPKEADLETLVFKDDVIDVESQSVLARRYEPVSAPVLKQMGKAGFSTIDAWDTRFDDGILLKTVMADPTKTEEDALKDIYHRLRPGDPPTTANARQLIKRLFFDPHRYDLGLFGRYKINQKLNLGDRVPDTLRTLDESGIDVIEALRHLLDIRCDRAQVDDIDHLGNRRIRTAGELLENQCRVGLSRMERLIRERMVLLDPGTQEITPKFLVNSKSLSAVVNDFFGRSQLSQFMDQNNPLSGLAHKRRLSALGPGGLSRERAGMDVRDVHPSHYGRICPIETPEGPNIGLISSLGIYARINPYGFIETPYRKVQDGKVTDIVEYMTADQEESYVIAQANSPLNDDGTFAESTVIGRYQTEFVEVESSRIEYMDVSPMQVVSIAAGLIPFLEHDDANRALMGANMMRQGVPLLRTERPYVATGLEERAAIDSCVTVLAEQDGVVAYVSATEIVVTPDGKLPSNRAKAKNAQRYLLQKFRRSNADTCFNQKPIVRRGQAVKKGDCLADGPATNEGELSLGKNLLVAFMPWGGYNFEDAILVSERVVRDDVFTSIHIQDYEVSARDTKLGPEEITRDIPNVGEDALRNLGPDGVVRVGAEVRPGDILVGKITPKGETELAPEERLLRAIFGEKAADVRDTSLTVPSGIYGIVMDVKVSTAQQDPKKAAAGGSHDSSLGGASAKDAEEERKKAIASLEEQLTTALSNVLLGEKIPLDVLDVQSGDILIPANRKITKTLLARLAKAWDHYQIDNSPVQQKIDEIVDSFKPRFVELDAQGDSAFDEIASEFNEGGVVKSVRVYIAQKKNLSVGDKLAGRHGNKGVVARILADCDMPFLPDGTPVDIVLNPMGVPSRMNLGQLFETYLGSACKMLGLYAASPVFDGAGEDDIDALLREARGKQVQTEGEAAAWIHEDGKSVVFDGRTGEPFDQRVVVGQIYMLKLHHLVTDKIHARATGPYSLITQQPLGGKAQYGGQRMGEMEVWALEAYGMAYTLQELLTVKSDDVAGRTRIYESIVKGENTLEAGMPESFSVLMSELRGLCLDMKLLGGPEKTATPALF